MSILDFENTIKSIQEQIQEKTQIAKNLRAKGIDNLNNSTTDIFVRERRKESGRNQIIQAAKVDAEIKSLQKKVQNLQIEKDVLISSDLFESTIDNQQDNIVMEKPDNNLKNLLLLGGALLVLA